MFSPKDGVNPPGQAERQRFEQDISRKLSGAGAGKILVTDGTYEPKQISYNPSDVQSTGLSEYDLARTANCFGVPLALLTTDTNLANLQAARAQHAEVVNARCHTIASVLTTLARQLDPRLCFAFDDAAGDDVEAKARVTQVQLGSGVLTINEARAESGYEPVPWGDEPWLPSSLRQPSEERPARLCRDRCRANRVTNQATTRRAKHHRATPQRACPHRVATSQNRSLRRTTRHEGKMADPFGQDDSSHNAADSAHSGDSSHNALTRSLLVDPFEPDESLDVAAVAARRMIRLAAQDAGVYAAYLDGSITYEQRRSILDKLAERAERTLRARFAAWLAEHGPQRKRDSPPPLASPSRGCSGPPATRRPPGAGRGPHPVGPGAVPPKLVEPIRREVDKRSVTWSDSTTTSSSASNRSTAPSPRGAEPMALPRGDRRRTPSAHYVPSVGMVEERRVHVGHDEPCPDCVAGMGAGWQPIGTLPPIFDSECRHRCHCHFEYRDRDGNVWTAGRGRTTFDDPEHFDSGDTVPF